MGPGRDKMERWSTGGCLEWNVILHQSIVKNSATGWDSEVRLEFDRRLISASALKVYAIVSSSAKTISIIGSL